MRDAESLSSIIYSMEEPWRGRFLVLVTKLATRQASGDLSPCEQEVANWQSADHHLRRMVGKMLYTWVK